MGRIVSMGGLLALLACDVPTAPSPTAPDRTEPASSVAGGGIDTPGPTEPASAAPVVVATVSGLVLDARWSDFATPIAATHDGRGWVGGRENALLVHDGTRVVQRFAVAVDAHAELAALPDGGWRAGPRLLDPDGRVRFDGHGWCNRVGRFGHCKSVGFGPDGAVAIIAASDAPGTGLAGRDPGSHRGELSRLTFEPGTGHFEVRPLVEHEERRDFVVAASERWVVAAEDRTLSIWPATGNDGPSTATLGGPVDRLAWADGDLVATRSVDPEHAEIEVLDADAGFARVARWTLDGQIEAIAVRPGGPEIAIGITWYRARATVEVDVKRIEVYALDGTRRARVELEGWPTSLAWTPRGDALLVAVSARTPADARVLRYAVR